MKQPPRPFFVAGETPPHLQRRLLLISFVFPPAQASGSLRWQKLSHYIVERGWALDVLTLHPSCVESPDPDRLSDLAPGTRVYGVRAPALRTERIVRTTWDGLRQLGPRLRERRAAPTAAAPTEATATGGAARPSSLGRSEIRWELRSSRGVIRAYSAWLDYARGKRWARDAAALGARLVDPGVHDAVITSGPPHMSHEAGRLLSRQTRLPFIMDMRDPWSLEERLSEEYASPLWLLLASRHERRTVAQAALVVTNTDLFRLAMRELYPAAAGRMITAMNGADEGPMPSAPHGERFVIAYAGAIYLDRDPRILFQAVARVVSELSLTPSDLAVEFIGHVDRYGSTPVSEIARQEGVAAFVSVHPPRSHRAALEFLAQATMLVSLPQDNDLAIPAKIFEYVRFDAWVLVLTTQGSATGMLLSQSGADVAAPGDLDGIAEILRMRFLQHRSGTRPKSLVTDGRFSRRGQAERLLDAVAKCTSRDRAPAEAVARA